MMSKSGWIFIVLETRLILIIGLFFFGLWRIFACGEDWYDAWFGWSHYNWFDCFGNFIFGTVVLGGVVLGLAILSAGLPGTATPAPAYSESTPIKTSSEKRAPHRKLHAKNRKVTKKVHV